MVLNGIGIQGYTASHWPLTRLHATDQHSPGSHVLPFVSLSVHSINCEDFMGDSVTNLTEVCLFCLLIPIFDQFLLLIVPFPFDASNEPMKTFYLIDENSYVLCSKLSLKSVFSHAFSVSYKSTGMEMSTIKNLQIIK